MDKPASTRVPHVRGDEPSDRIPSNGNDHVFPTCVGMNRVGECVGNLENSVPHVRGDEPTMRCLTAGRSWCSPRAWG